MGYTIERQMSGDWTVHKNGRLRVMVPSMEMALEAVHMMYNADRVAASAANAAPLFTWEEYEQRLRGSSEGVLEEDER